MTAHVSALVLDALALDALPPDEVARVRAHLAACATCSRDHESSAARRVAFDRDVLPRTLPAIVARAGRLRSNARRGWGAWWLAVPALAAAVVAIVLIGGDSAERAERGDEPPELAFKGGTSWQVFARRAGRTFAVREPATLAAGDRVRFVITAERACYILVASVDGAGRASIYYPYGGGRSEPLAAGRTELEGSIVLDSSPGPERVFAIVTDRPIASAQIGDTLRAIGARGGDAIRATPRLPVAARAQLSIVFEKAP